MLAQAQAVVALFPTLSLSEGREEFVLSGTFVLEQGGVAFDAYEVRLHIPHAFPAEEPKLFETGGRIAHTNDFHVNNDGSACYDVFECWVATTDDASVVGFVNGPMLNFFLSQTVHELSGKWPFGERSHGFEGLIEASAEAIDVENDLDAVQRRLKILSEWPSKGHHPCPCGNGKRFRECHRPELGDMHERIPSALAERLAKRILKYLPREPSGQGGEKTSDAA